MTETQELRTLRIATGGREDTCSVDEFLEAWGRSILRMEMEPLGETPLAVDLTVRVLPQITLAAGSLSPMHNRHTAELAEDNDFILVVIRRGAGEVRQHGRIAAVREGEAVLTANGEAGSFSGLTATDVINFRLGRNLLAREVAHPDDCVARPIRRDCRALQLLAGYGAVLDSQAELATPVLKHAIAVHMHELAGLAIAGEAHAAATSDAAGIRAARLHAIKAEVAAEPGRRDLSASAVAARHAITPRYLHMLFEGEERTFSEFVLDRRLDHALRLLVDPRTARLSVSEVAFSSGFGDLSHFNRTFRRRFGMTPSEARRGG